MDLILQEWNDGTPWLACLGCANRLTPHRVQEVLHRYTNGLEERLLSCCQCGQWRTQVGE
jgi:hypothetical protein